MVNSSFIFSRTDKIGLSDEFREVLNEIFDLVNIQFKKGLVNHSNVFLKIFFKIL